jgi:ankyrin repeat protein
MSSKGKILFDLIKNHQYDKIITIIKSDDKIELNDIDESGLYLIQYAILFRQKDLVALLISKGCKLDVLDSDGRSIFYVPIKFGYNEIVRLLINFSNVVVGIPLLEMQDNKLNIPIHYAIMFNKYDIIEEILYTNSNINFKDEDGNTALHLLVKNIKTDKLSILKALIDKKIGINHINKLGQNALHIATDNGNYEVAKMLLEANININTETIDDHLTPLIIATIRNDIKLCELLLNHKADINYQDIYGNSVLNHAIFNKSKQLIELYWDKINVNLVNISGQISANLFFENDYDMAKLDDYRFREILTKSKLNLQNSDGRTLLHNLIQYGIWENYIEIISQKKNKIFIQDINGISPYDLLKKSGQDKLDKFIDIVANSFYNYITENNISTYKINIDCDLTNNKKTTEQKNKCIQAIKKYIIENNISYPEKKKSYCMSEIITNDIKFSSYVGIGLDIVCGLLYLKNKYPNISTTLTSDFIQNDNLEEYYKKNGIQKGLSDFLNYEIIWSFHKMFIPNNIKSTIEKFKNDDSKEYLVFPVGIELSNGAHANILLYKKSTNTMERFEPYGKDFPPGFNYIPGNLDLNIKNLFSNYFNTDNNKFIYISPSEYSTKIGLQLLDSIEYSKEKNIGDPGGFCAAWSLWYVEMRVNNIDIERQDLINRLINSIRLKRVSFRSVIRNFTKNITDLRDKILAVGSIDINKWLNDNYTETEYDIIIKHIISMI